MSPLFHIDSAGVKPLISCSSSQSLASIRRVGVGALFLAAFLLFSIPNSAQVVGDAFTPSEVRIEQGPSSGPTHVPRPVIPSAEAKLNAATFVVNYNGFTPDRPGGLPICGGHLVGSC